MHSHILILLSFQVFGDLDLDVELVLWWRREKTDLVLHLYDFLCNTVILMFMCDIQKLCCYPVVFFVYIYVLCSKLVIQVMQVSLINIFSLHTRLISMERLEWMYLILRLSHPFIEQVKKFVDSAQKHPLSVNQKGIICSCSRYKNKQVLLLDGDDVKSLT